MTKRTIISAVLLSLAFVGAACGPDQRIIDSAKEQNASKEAIIANSNINAAASNFEQDLTAMRTADFKFIVVFRRKDGKPLDGSDKELIGKVGSQANRRRLSDEGKAVIIGTSFPFRTGEFESVNERFKMENYSKPDSGPMFANANVNTNTNSKR